MSIDFTPTVERFSGFADLYDRYRPAPPPALAVREAVGPDMALMRNPFHYYSHEEALALGRKMEFAYCQSLRHVVACAKDCRPAFIVTANRS